MKRTFAVGTGKVDITPPLNIPYLGFSPRHSFFKGVHDPLYARSLYVSDGDTELMIVATDTIGLANDLFGPARDFTAEVREGIEAATGVNRKNIMLASSHIHSTPETLGIRPLKDHPGAISWLETLKEYLVSSARLARENTFRATLKIGKGTIGRISCNRRGDNFIDDELIVLCFESRNSEKIFLVNAVCHPVIVQVQELISADFVGVVQTNVERMIKKTRACIFLQGACGDINPKKGCTKDFKDVYLMGLAITGEVIKVFAQLELQGSSLQPAILKTERRRITFSSRPLPRKSELEKIRKESREGNYMAQETIRRVRQGKGPFEGEVQVMRIGNALLVGIPGEPFCQMGLEIKDKSAPFHGVPVGYANGYLGYIASPKAWEKGGYEVSCGPWSKVGPESYEIIMRVFNQLKTEVS